MTYHRGITLIISIVLLSMLLYPNRAVELVVVKPSPDMPHSQLIQAALDDLDPAREHYEKVQLVGEFSIDAPVYLSSFTYLDLTQAKLTLEKGVESLLSNRDQEGGNHHISIVGGVLEGSNHTVSGDGGGHGISLRRSRDVAIENIEIHGFSGDGIRLSGGGKHTFNSRLNNVKVSGNGRFGLNITWAMRAVQVSNVVAEKNGQIGVRIDHSEGQYSNIFSDRNGGDGIYIRNVFGGSYANLTATRNGRAGIFVLGMVNSVGSNWLAHNNGRLGQKEHSDLFFSASKDLSYGISASSVISGLSVGAYKEYGDSQQRYAIEFESPQPKMQHPGLRLLNLNISWPRETAPTKPVFQSTTGASGCSAWPCDG
jgi:hypothetical protein